MGTGAQSIVQLRNVSAGDGLGFLEKHGSFSLSPDIPPGFYKKSVGVNA